MPRALVISTMIGLVSWATIPVSSAQVVLSEYVGSSGMGRSVSAAGDVDADGFEDYLVGAPYPGGSTAPSRVVVVSGKDGAVLHDLTAPNKDQLGLSVAGIGDADADGFADFAVGVARYPAPSGGIGEVRVYSGQLGGLLFTVGSPDTQIFFGTAVSAIGDVNLDGFDDVAAGGSASHVAGTGYGQVKIASGKDGAVLHALVGSSFYNGFGGALAPAGDFDQDGVPDLVAGSPREDISWKIEAGKVEVISGQDATILRTWTGAYNGDQLGREVAGGVDLDGDGWMDVAASATGANGGRGQVRAYSGANGALRWTVTGDGPGEGFGFALAMTGDVNRDGVADVLVGAPFDAEGAGTVSALSGLDGARVFRIPGAPYDHLGTSVSGYVDIDSDGDHDFVVGFPLLGLPGAARVYGGQDCPGSLTTYGAGCVDAGGSVPVLSLQGCPGQDGWIELRLDTYYPAIAVLFVGTVPADLPVAGDCSLLVWPAAFQVVLPANGLFQGLNAQLPAVVPAVAIHAQAFVQDLGVPVGMTATQGVSLILP